MTLQMSITLLIQDVRLCGKAHRHKEVYRSFKENWTNQRVWNKIAYKDKRGSKCPFVRFAIWKPFFEAFKSRLCFFPSTLIWTVNIFKMLVKLALKSSDIVFETCTQFKLCFIKFVGHVFFCQLYLEATLLVSCFSNSWKKVFISTRFSP